MTFVYTSFHLLAIYGLAIVLLSLPSQLSAHVITQREDSPGPVSSFTVFLTHFQSFKPTLQEAYAVPAVVGDTSIELHLDCGSDRSWVLSDLLPDDQYEDSVKFKARGLERCPAPAVQYLDGTKVEGELVSDTTVKIESVETKNGILAASSITPKDELCAISDVAGNIGFDFSSTSWVKSAYEKGKIKSIFTFDLRLADRPKAVLSLDSSEVSDKITWFPRYEEDRPKFKGLGTWSFLPLPNTPCALDSGAVNMYLPRDVVRNYYKQENFGHTGSQTDGSSEYWMYRCDQDIPDFVLSHGDINVKIPGSDLKGRERTKYPGWCEGRLVGYDNSYDETDPSKYLYYVLGVPFMKNHRTHFDMKDNGRVGIEFA